MAKRTGLGALKHHGRRVRKADKLFGGVNKRKKGAISFAVDRMGAGYHVEACVARKGGYASGTDVKRRCAYGLGKTPSKGLANALRSLARSVSRSKR